MTFAETIADQVQSSISVKVGEEDDAAQRIASAILGSPEMKAIKAAMYQHVARQVFAADETLTVAAVRRSIDLPQAVVDWVMS